VLRESGVDGQHSHYHTTLSTRGTLWGGKYHRCSPLKAWKAAYCDEIRPQVLKVLNRKIHWLACVSSCLVFWGALKAGQNMVVIVLQKREAEVH